MAEHGDFYEDDEPVEQVVMAFEHGYRVTSVSDQDVGRGQTLSLPDEFTPHRTKMVASDNVNLVVCS